MVSYILLVKVKIFLGVKSCSLNLGAHDKKENDIELQCDHNNYWIWPLTKVTFVVLM